LSDLVLTVEGEEAMIWMVSCLMLMCNFDRKDLLESLDGVLGGAYTAEAPLPEDLAAAGDVDAKSLYSAGWRSLAHTGDVCVPAGKSWTTKLFLAVSDDLV
jgi:hypothetical protein